MTTQHSQKQNDAAEYRELSESLRLLSEHLDTYRKFSHPDALASQTQWYDKLNHPLPENAAGLNDKGYRTNHEQNL